MTSERIDGPLCPCKDRPASQCPGEWEKGCDLGANPKHVAVHNETPEERALLNAALGIPVKGEES